VSGPDVVFVGEERPGTRAQQRLRAMRALGRCVEFVRSHAPGETYETRPSLETRLRHRLRRPADSGGTNGRLRALASEIPPPAVLWIDYVRVLLPETYRELRRRWPDTRFVWYSEDDMMRPHNGSVWLDRSTGFFDLWVTTKSFNAAPDEMPSRGVRRVMFVDNAFDPETHREISLDAGDRERFGADISFVGTYEAARARSIAALAEAGFRVRIWGNGWERLRGAAPGIAIEGRPVYGDDLAKVYGASAVNLAFLRKINRDLQTCRTVEIPACGGFMLHERTEEATTLLEDGREAAFFSDDAELIDQCRRWLGDPEGRRAVAAAGRDRLHAGGHSHGDCLEKIFASLETEK
jgi:spore maturation protein CgeB